MNYVWNPELEEISDLTYASPIFEKIIDFADDHLNELEDTPDVPWNHVLECANNLFLRVSLRLDFHRESRIKKYGIIVTIMAIVLKNFIDYYESYILNNFYVDCLIRLGIINRNDRISQIALLQYMPDAEVEILELVNWVPCPTFRESGFF